MAKVIFGNHASVIVPRQDRDSIRKFYKGTSFVWEKTSISGFSMGMSLMRASSYELQDRFGSKSNPSTWKK